MHITYINHKSITINPLLVSKPSTNSTTMEPKKTRGRQRIEIKKLQGNQQQVTFSKRRKGLFNKASELCVVTNAEVAVLAQSVGGRVFAFGHPSVDRVVEAYLGNNVVDWGEVGEDLRSNYEEWNKKYLEIVEETKVEKAKVSIVEESSRRFWWENCFEDLEVDELEIFIDSMEKLKTNLMVKGEELKINEIANADDPQSLDDQVVVPNSDQFVSYNVGFANGDLMMPAVNYGSSGLNKYGFVNDGLVLDDNGGDNLQDLSDFGTFGVPNTSDLYFSQD
ncbi:hypothetical protein DCAR_0936110 [Daucus carota subsp. sativus]|uniref:MADS-box domain-containing protein n=1 Tax=Daucus carota subsp. sativus TaxID=79200 RepID=A0AAF0Y1S3_DAUCS|nr:hypothetical protein DCAR_0936110 [Daucus carota subsp. sativus]